MQPINRLPKDIFITIPYFFTEKKRKHNPFLMNKHLVTMTHVCRSWRNVLLSTQSLWTHLQFSTSTSTQAVGFLGRSGKQLLHIHAFFESEDKVEPFLSAALHNTHRLRRLEIVSLLEHLEHLLARFTRSAPELEHLKIVNDPNTTERDMKLPRIIFECRLPKLTSLFLMHVHTNLRQFNLPFLTRLDFTTSTNISIRDLTSFFERSPLLESIRLRLDCTPQPPTAPPRKRILLAALEELRLDQTASASGLLEHFTLPNCTEMMLKGQFTDEELDQYGSPAPRIHRSFIDNLPIMRGITKAVATPNSCIFSGPNGTLRIWCFGGTRENFDAEFFTLFSPIPVTEIKELLVGVRFEPFFGAPRSHWKQTVARVRGVFAVLTKVEDLTIVSCDMLPFFTTLGTTTNNGVPLPGLRRFTIYVGCGDLEVSALVQCARARLRDSRPLKEVAIIFENEPGADVKREAESLGGFVRELNYRVGVTPGLEWGDKDGEMW